MSDSAQMVIANRLRDGLTVFRTAEGSWAESIAEGLVVDDEAAARALLVAAEADAGRNLVVSPYLIAVTNQNGIPRPVSWREAIRAAGPTVETGREPG